MEKVGVARVDVGDELMSLNQRCQHSVSAKTGRTHLAKLAEPVESVESVLGLGPEESHEAERRLLRLAVEGLELGRERAKAGEGDRFRVAVWEASRQLLQDGSDRNDSQST